MIKSPNYAFQSVSDKGKTQAPLHSRYARVGEYPFSSSELVVPLPNFASQNSTKLNIKSNSDWGFPAGFNLTEVKK